VGNTTVKAAFDGHPALNLSQKHGNKGNPQELKNDMFARSSRNIALYELRKKKKKKKKGKHVNRALKKRKCAQH